MMHSRTTLIGAVVVLMILIYGASLGNDFVRWDDGLLIYENPVVSQLTPRSVARAFTMYDPELYIPLTFLSYQIDHLIGGTSPFIYHVTNLILHTLNALLVLVFVTLLTGKRWMGIFCGLLFAVHPLHTEAVVWASSRKDLLSTFFFLGSLVGYLLYRTQQNTKWYRWSIALFAFGLLSKVQIVVLPVLLLLLDYWEKRQWNREMLREKVPYFLLSIIFGIVAIFGKTTVVAGSTLLEKILMASKSIIFYLQKILIPTDLSVLYPYTGDVILSSPDFFIPLILCAVLVGIMVATLRRSRDVSCALALFLITLAPTFINFSKGGIGVYFASDRYTYAASIGIFLLLALLIERFVLRGATFALDRHKSLAAFFGAVILIFSFMSFQQSLVWKNTETLFTHVLSLYPESHIAHASIAGIERRRGNIDAAIEGYEQAISIKQHPRSLSNLAATYRQKGMVSKAIELYEKAMEVDERSADPHFGIGVVYAELGQYEKALEEYGKALELDDEFDAELHTNIGAIEMRQGRVDEAIASFDAAIAADPFFAQAHYNLGIARTKKRDLIGAEQSYKRAVSLYPAFISARLNLGVVLYEQGKTEESAEQFKAVLRIDPGNQGAAKALRQMGY